jgi:hypothetical protein
MRDQCLSVVIRTVEKHREETRRAIIAGDAQMINFSQILAREANNIADGIKEIEV